MRVSDYIMDLSHLNSAQREAVESANGACVIVAGPGTGKTRVFASRAAYLIREKGVPSARILGVTFTRSAALEMRERIRTLLADEAAMPDLWLDTFHALALRLLREQEYPFGPGVHFEIASEEEKSQFFLHPFPLGGPRSVVAGQRTRQSASLQGRGQEGGNHGRFNQSQTRLSSQPASFYFYPSLGSR